MLHIKSINSIEDISSPFTSPFSLSIGHSVSESVALDWPEHGCFNKIVHFPCQPECVCVCVVGAWFDFRWFPRIFPLDLPSGLGFCWIYLLETRASLLRRQSLIKSKAKAEASQAVNVSMRYLWMDTLRYFFLAPNPPTDQKLSMPLVNDANYLVIETGHSWNGYFFRK